MSKTAEQTEMKITPKPELVVVARNPKVAEALKAKAPEFKNATVVESYDADSLRGKHVLTTQLPPSVASVTASYIQVGLPVSNAEVETMSAFEILAKMYQPTVIEMSTTRYRDWIEKTLVNPTEKKTEEFSDSPQQ